MHILDLNGHVDPTHPEVAQIALGYNFGGPGQSLGLGLTNKPAPVQP